MAPLIQQKEEKIMKKRSEQQSRKPRSSTGSETDEKQDYNIMTQTIQMTISGSIGYILDYSQDFVNMLFLSFSFGMDQGK